jgi:hypothetical protein
MRFIGAPQDRIFPDGLKAKYSKCKRLTGEVSLRKIRLLSVYVKRKARDYAFDKPTALAYGVPMAAVAYLTPLSNEMQQQFDSLNLNETRQEEIFCTGCGVRYVLVYPENAGAEVLAGYRNAVLGNMGNCGAHQPRITFNY